jgi:hypothetical protein
VPPPEEAGREPAEERKQKMATTRSSGTADEVNARLLELLEQMVANQAVQATADLNQEVAERLSAALRYRQDQDQANAGLSQEQLRLVLHFRALRNAQGNLARHADQGIVLMPPPTLHDNGTLEFVKALPHQAETMRLFGPDGKQTGRRDRIGGATKVQNVGDVASVQIDDAKGNPILLGFPQPPAPPFTE